MLTFHARLEFSLSMPNFCVVFVCVSQVYSVTVQFWGGNVLIQSNSKYLDDNTENDASTDYIREFTISQAPHKSWSNLKFGISMKH